jgi:hypothetical protein
MRFARRRKLWKLTSPREILDAGFRNERGEPDDRVSVYELASDGNDVVRAYAEHAAGAGLSPPTGAEGMNLRGLASDVRPSPGTTPFAFTRSVHREIVLTEAELLEMIAVAVQEARHRHFEISRHELAEFVGGRIESGDSEWAAFLASSPKSDKWKGLRHRRASE